MLNFIPKRFVIHLLLLLFTAVMLFHLLVMLGVIPFEIVWGGRLTREKMIQFESASLLLNGVMLTVIGIYAGYVNLNVNPKILKGAFWIMVALFFLNTLGNLYSNNDLEKIIFTPVTMLLTVFCLRLAMD